jgi:hypothetical protein
MKITIWALGLQLRIGLRSCGAYAEEYEQVRGTTMSEDESGNDACAHEKKPETSLVQRKRLKSSSNSLLREQKFFYKVFVQVASLLESCVKPTPKVLFKIRRVKGDRRHFEQRIKDSETFADRDKILRDLAAYCYQEGKKFTDMGDPGMQMKWLKLLERFLRLSQSLMSDKKFEEELAEMERKVKVIQAAQDDRVTS